MIHENEDFLILHENINIVPHNKMTDVTANVL